MTVDEAIKIVEEAADIDLEGIAHVLMYVPAPLKPEHEELAAAVLTLVVKGQREGAFEDAAWAYSQYRNDYNYDMEAFAILKALAGES